MQKVIAYPQRSLSIYLARGKKILSLLINGEEETAIEWASLHRAAFHNFLALETKYGLDSAQLAAFMLIWGEIEIINQEIMQQIARLVQEAQEKLFSIQREKNRLRKFRSFPTEESTFQRSI